MNSENSGNYEFSAGLGSLQPSLTLGLTQKAKELIGRGEDVLSLCAGEPDYDTPEHIKQAAVQALAEGDTKYTPSSGRPDLRQAIAEKLEQENGIACRAGQVIVSPGAKFSVFAAIAVLCRPGDRVLVPSPYWLSYPEMIRAAGAEPVFVPTLAENDFCATVDCLESCLPERARMLILNTPSNPTGGIYQKRELERIAEFALRHDLMVVADEIYEKLIYEEGSGHISLAALGKDIAARTMTVNGFSKAYSMTGWRLGYQCAPLPVAKRIDALQSHTTSNPTSFAQAGALAALRGPQKSVEGMRLAFKERRDVIYDLLAEIPGVKVHKPGGAFYIFPDISSFGLDSMTFSERLLEEEKLAVVPGFPFGSNDHLRLSYAYGLDTIRRAVERLAAFCAKL